MLPGVGGVLVLLPGGWWWLVVSWSAYSQQDTQAGTRKAPQCGGALACETKLQGEIDGHDCSNYQLFRCSSWDSFYRLVDKLKH